MDPFIEHVTATLIKRVEGNLRQIELRPLSTLEENQVTPELVETMLRAQIVYTLEDYTLMVPSALIGVVSASPSLLTVAGEDLDAPLSVGPSGPEAWAGVAKREHGQRSQTFVPSVGQRWADIASDPEKAEITAKAMGIEGYQSGQAINPPDLIRNVVLGRVRWAEQEAFKHDFSPVVAEVNADLEQRYIAASEREKTLEGLTPEWRSFLESSGQPDLSQLSDAAPSFEAAAVEPSHDL